MSFSETLVWLEKAPDANLGYAIDLTQGEIDPGDTVLKASVSVSPSGAGEDLIVSAPLGVVPVYIQDGYLAIWFKGGVPGRVYLVRVILETEYMTTHSLLVSLPIVRTFQNFVPPEIISSDFTEPVTWLA